MSLDSDNPNFSGVALKILRERYLWRNKQGEVLETPRGMLERVARVVSKGDAKLARSFYRMMARLDFLPNSPTLMNAGREGIHGQLSACYVLDVPDTLEGIFETLKRQALIHKSGGGTGFNFSKIRAKGKRIASTGGEASGPLSFMELFNVTTAKVMQGGMRRGANMAILDADHPDVLDFINAKSEDGPLGNFNLSVGVTDDFMERMLEGEEYENRVWTQIVRKARNTGDPGLVFLDTINRANTTSHLGPLKATNPCGETPLYPNEACNLGSINLANFVGEDKGVMVKELIKTVESATIFLNNVVDVNSYPLPEITEAVRRTRKIGLGVMGWADMLIKMGLPYDSEEARELADKVMGHIQTVAARTSEKIASESGAFPAYAPAFCKYPPRANATLTCVAPTGTISLLAGCSSGIEPLFALSHERKALDATETFTFVNREYELALRDQADTRIADGVFKTAHEIAPIAHIRMQAAFQEHTDLAVSKTINLPFTAAVSDVNDAFIAAWKNGCKGITVYRDGCKAEQVLYALPMGVCEECGSQLEHTEGCSLCPSCGWSPCGV